jgi:hypothetical protein
MWGHGGHVRYAFVWTRGPTVTTRHGAMMLWPGAVLFAQLTSTYGISSPFSVHIWSWTPRGAHTYTIE